MSQDYAAPAGVYEGDDAVAAPAEATYSLGTRMAAEAFGTFLLVLGIVGTATFNFLNTQGTILTVALAGGVMLLAGISAVGHVSGGHFNPAVTFGAAIAGRTRWADLLPYWVAQLVGAAVAAAVMWALIPSTLPKAIGDASRGAVLGRTANGWDTASPLSTASQGATSFSLLTALIIEVVVTAAFVGVILAVTSKRSRIQNPAIVIGATLGALIIVAWPVTNASLNPARSFASVVFAGSGHAWGQLWLFWVAPLVGAGLAALFTLVFAPVGGAPAVEELDEMEDTYEAAPAPEPYAPETVAPANEEVTEVADVEDVAAPEDTTPEKPQA